jgi:hypothetical protein
MRALALVLAVALGGLLTWQFMPRFQAQAPVVTAEPRMVAPRGDLAADEKSTIELFERAKGSVVFITTTQLVRDFWSRNMFSIPRGAGSASCGTPTGMSSPTTTWCRAPPRPKCG